MRIVDNVLPGSAEDIAAQLCALKSKPTSSGRELLLDKTTTKRDSGVEMDEADAVMLAFLDVMPVKRKRRRARVIGVVEV